MKIKNTYFVEEYRTSVPEKLDEWKVAFPEAVVERFVNGYSKKGDVVFDPFSGFGTTLKVAKRLGRKVFGTEIEKDKIDFAKKKFGVELIEKSAFELDYRKYPRIDLCIFSPPYWGPALGAENYLEYLGKLEGLAEKIKERMNGGAHMIVFLQNYHEGNRLLTLAWDVGNVIKNILKLEQDVIWCIDRSESKRDVQHEAADHHYCLVFKK